MRGLDSDRKLGITSLASLISTIKYFGEINHLNACNIMERRTMTPRICFYSLFTTSVALFGALFL